MNAIDGLQALLLLALGLAAVGVEGWALIAALRYPDAAYVAAGKLTRGAWLAILGICLAVGIVTMRAVIFSMGWIAVLGPAVFLADVRPALEKVMGR